MRLRVNGLSEARFLPDDPFVTSTTDSDVGSTTEVALGLLPCLAHPAPRRALVIGHGAGWTAEAVLATDVPWVDVAELDETLLDVVEEWRGVLRWNRKLRGLDRDGDRRVSRPEWDDEAQAFAQADADRNGFLDRGDPPVITRLQARTDTRAHLRLTDGRLLLRRAANDAALRYDVIASQPSHPWVPGAGHLFTREAYALARGALTADGVFAQWLNLFEMSEELLRASLATFRDVFPTCWLFLFDREAVVLGFVSEPRLDTARWERLLEVDGPVRRLSDGAGIHTPGDLWSHVTLDGAGVERLAPAEKTPLVVDDRPALELGLAWRVLRNAQDEDLEKFLRRGFPPDVARLVPDRTVRDRWTAHAIDSLLAARQVEVALLWDDKVEWGTDPTSRVVRAAVARARGELARAEVILRSVVDELVRGDAKGLAAHGDWVSGWIMMLAEGARMEPQLRRSLLAGAQAVADRLPGDGRVRAALAHLRASANDIAGARAEYVEALAAKDPPAPPGTGVALARLVLATSALRGPPPAVAPGPTVGDDPYVLALLRNDPGTWEDRTALDLLARLELRVGADADATRAEAVLERLERMDEQEAVEAFRAAWARLPEGHGNSLGDAQRAAARAPTWVEAWELVALSRLQLHAMAEHAAHREEHQREALYALGRAWEHAKDRAREERRARLILGWYGLGDANLVRVEGE